jgi:hypothetical protein
MKMECTGLVVYLIRFSRHCKLHSEKMGLMYLGRMLIETGVAYFKVL